MCEHQFLSFVEDKLIQVEQNRKLWQGDTDNIWIKQNIWTLIRGLKQFMHSHFCLCSTPAEAADKKKVTKHYSLDRCT